MITIAILSGGKSSRMGTDKALLPIEGKTMIEHIIAQVKDIGDEVIVITNTPDHYKFLGLPLFADVIPDKGALGGLYTAIDAASHPYTLILACDMPFVNRDLLRYMISLAPQGDAVIPKIAAPDGEKKKSGMAEPLRAIYSKACLAPIRKCIDEDNLKMIAFFKDVKLRWIDEEEIRRFDPDLVTFMNANTPGEFEKMKGVKGMKG
ncbi:MAG: molybdenum cofactor guanylyltransferase [Chloroflexi bacterium]|nr:molybdenum cofactor guanylyltransferase [Chloroflexota bacterium]MBI5712648.1 molybdenum cofactor guanylyltransferase [Chloroflexota bacterium]